VNSPHLSRPEKFGQSPRVIFPARELDLGNLPRIDAHLHTAWTDGQGRVGEVYAAAVGARLEAIVYSEHSRKTSVDWFPTFAAEVRGLPQAPCRAYVGTECKVESRSGAVDTAPDISNLCDFVTASVHRFPDAQGQALRFDEVAPGEAVELEYQLTWAVLENPVVDILGHMFGMSYRRFKVDPPDEKFQALIERAARFGVAVEINTRYHAKCSKMIQWCRDYDAFITFGSDAHTLKDIGANVKFLHDEIQNR
jgi:putative hydrolase